MSTHIWAKKSLGQHFLSDPNILGRIAELSLPAPGSGVVEVGPGTGNLTAHLLERLPRDEAGQAPLLVVERDRRMAPVLLERFGPVFDLIEGDAATLEWSDVFRHPQVPGRKDLGPQPVVVGNLPYYAAVDILWAALLARPARLVLMVQKEVADRFAARHDTSDYGQLSVRLQMRADVRLAFKVGPRAFSPPPKVDSAVVVIQPLPGMRYDVGPVDAFDRLVQAGFGHRRKTLVNALQTSTALAPDTVRQALQDLGLDERIRAEAVDLPRWAELGRRLGPLLTPRQGRPDQGSAIRPPVD